MARMYLVFIILCMCIGYGILRVFLPAFFEKPKVAFVSRNLISLLIIAVVGTLAISASFIPRDIELGNRILHTFGGGFFGFLVCFLAARDAKLPLSRFQFVCISALIVTALGVANELVEFVLQETTHYLYSPTIIDTWLDLSSNTVGILLGALCLTPFFTGREEVR